MDGFTLKNTLLCRGLDTGGADVGRGRKGGAGPAGTCLEVGRWIVNTGLNYSASRPSPLKLRLGERPSIIADGEEVPVSFINEPAFYGKTTSDGTPMKKVALLHGRDCLATTLYQRCAYMEQGRGCAFCAIHTTLDSGATILRKTPRQLGEVLMEARKDGVTHMVITTGTPNTRDHGARMLARAVEHLKSLCNIPVHVQLTPPSGRYLDLLHRAGADTIGIHMESFDSSVMRRVCPGKSGLDYGSALEYAAGLFGDGQVSSFILGGLGEAQETMKEGFEALATMGVIPFLVPFRPLPGSAMEHHPPPDPSYMAGLYLELADILIKYGLDISGHRAGCVRCGACSAIDTALEMRR